MAFRERAFLICRGQGGEMVHGDVITGEFDHVAMPTHCPVAATPVAVFHTHPPGDSLLPSVQDAVATYQEGLDMVCVGVGHDVACYSIKAVHALSALTTHWYPL